MTKETTSLVQAFASGVNLTENYKEIGGQYLATRLADNPEFQKEFLKTFSDLVFSRTPDQMDELMKMRPNSLLHAVFEATEAGASFAKREVSLLPYQIYKKEKVNGVDKKTATGVFAPVLVFDINFQKQKILKLENCARFFTAQVHEGVKVINDLTTGQMVFSGENDASKPTIGYYALFEATDGQKYDCFMFNHEIIDRAKSSPQFDASKYQNQNNNIHFEKIVVRNLLKLIPKNSKALRSILASDESGEFADFIEVKEVREQPNALAEAKKRLNAEILPDNTEVDVTTGEVLNVAKNAPKEAKKGNSEGSTPNAGAKASDFII